MIGAKSIWGEPATAAICRTLAASLPLSFRAAPPERGGAADVWLVDGAGAWVDEALRLVSDTDGWIIVVDPGLQAPAKIQALADSVDRRGARLALSESYAGDPILPDFAAQLPASIRVCNMRMATGGGLARAVLAQLRVARALGLTDLTMRDGCAAPGGALLTLHGAFGEADVTLRALASSTRAGAWFEAKFHGVDAAAELRLFGGENARAGEAFIEGGTDRRQLPTIYETAHRSLLRTLATRAPMLPAELHHFAADVARVDALGLE